MPRVIVDQSTLCSLEHGSSTSISTLTVPENFAEGALERMEGEHCHPYQRNYWQQMVPEEGQLLSYLNTATGMLFAL